MNAGEKVSRAAFRLIRSGTRMQARLDDMVDFNRTRLGLGINVAQTNVDLAQLFADELDLLPPYAASFLRSECTRFASTSRTGNHVSRSRYSSNTGLVLSTTIRSIESNSVASVWKA